ncbi:MAG: NAD(P)-binding protein [Ignavibacteriae bacterium]|nr:NAD(P)-binding protein [Ignavibacteriota bacterium]
MKKVEYDVIVVGAGISGLLIASELSNNHSVLVIEKESNIPTNKYWLTNKKSVKNNPELSNCIDSSYDHMNFIAYDGAKFKCLGDYILWDTIKLLGKLKTDISNNGSKVLTNYQFYSYRYNQSSISITANAEEFSSKLLIDCMGFASPIIYAKNLIDIYGYYYLNGAVLKLKKEIDPIGLSNISLSKSPKYLEVFPKKNNTAYVVLIQPEKSISKNTTIKQEFNFLVSKSSLSNYFVPEEDKTKSLFGLIPVGKLKTQSLDRIYLFGEAGQMNPGATATCLTQLFYSYKEIALELSKRIRANKLSIDNLTIENPSFTKLNKRFHLNLFKNILDWNSDDFKSLILQMNNMDNKLVNDVIFGEIDFQIVVKWKNIKNLLSNKNYFVLKPLLKSLLT